MTSPSAAALTEQIAEVLGQRIHLTEPNGGTGRNVIFQLPAFQAKALATLVAARLADSRPAVTEGATNAAARLMWEWDGYDNEPGEEGIADRYRHVARAALTAALPHLGDGLAGAQHQPPGGHTMEQDTRPPARKAPGPPRPPEHTHPDGTVCRWVRQRDVNKWRVVGDPWAEWPECPGFGEPGPDALPGPAAYQDWTTTPGTAAADHQAAFLAGGRAALAMAAETRPFPYLATANDIRNWLRALAGVWDGGTMLECEHRTG